jgi:hypothetical protein
MSTPLNLLLRGLLLHELLLHDARLANPDLDEQ